MTDKVESNGRGKWHPAAIAIVSAMLGSGGSIALVFNTPVGQEITRPDPFTGSQGASLTQRVDHLEEDVNDHLSHHPDAENQFDRRIATLEAQYAIILANQGRILDRLDNQ